MRAHVRARVEFVSIEIRPGGETARQVTIIEIIVKVTRFIKKEIVSPIFPPIASPLPGPGPFPKPTGTIYVVRSGDSVWKIAQMFGVSMESIIAANNLQNPNLIFPGQQLIIPGR
ncbi:MAG: LysM peptidoglycan-binding domain-containing protein [Dethiobacter sp.]|nr:LysM peptidoglycan-binding domain-containing protein [Dethiobacter sp.]